MSVVINILRKQLDYLYQQIESALERSEHLKTELQELDLQLSHATKSATEVERAIKDLGEKHESQS